MDQNSSFHTHAILKKDIPTKSLITFYRPFFDSLIEIILLSNVAYTLRTEEFRSPGYYVMWQS